jgi:hypothetical protein
MTTEPSIDWTHAVMADPTTLSVPVVGADTDWRDEFKRAVIHDARDFGTSGWGEILLIGDRVVVKDVMAGAEGRLKASLEELVGRTYRTAVRAVRMRNAAREELKQTLLTRERTARAMQDRFRSF